MTQIPATFGAFVPGEHHIELVSGKYLNLSDPQADVITVGVIAHGLSHTCRFAGHTRRFYSVAEHACLVAAKLEYDGAEPHVIYAGLHHDDPEAFIGDVTRPLKALMPRYADLEERLAEVIAEALRLPALTDPDELAMVKAADDWALSCEAWNLLPSGGETWFCAGLYEPNVAYDLRFPYDMLGQSADRARDLYLLWDQDVGRRMRVAADGTVGVTRTAGTSDGEGPDDAARAAAQNQKERDRG